MVEGAAVYAAFLAHMSQSLMDRADALIWAVEAGTRASMGVRTGAQNVQAMVEETAKQAMWFT